MHDLASFLWSYHGSWDPILLGINEQVDPNIIILAIYKIYTYHLYCICTIIAPYICIYIPFVAYKII